jgi:molecular chaperone GrpE
MMEKENPASQSPEPADPGIAPAAEDETGAAGQEKSVEERLTKAEEDAQRYLDNWRRAEADLQNFKKRSEQERDESRRYATAAIIINLLPIVDDFERAFNSLDSLIAGLSWFDGIRLIYRKLLMSLENAGVRPIQSEGEMFDPRYHEAVAHVDGEEGKVISEVQRGYVLHDRVLRPAMVAVGKGAAAEGETSQA